MNAWTTPERQALREAVTRFTEREIAPHLAQWEDDGRLPRELSRAAADAGILGVGFAEEVGGQGGDAVDTAVVTEALLGAGGSTGVVAALMTYGIAVPHIVDSGNRDLVDRFVRPTLAGELIGSLGVTEPGGGSDVARITTRAVRDGDHYVVDGAKTYITSAVRGDFVTTAVRTGGPGSGGISLLVIERGTPGFTVSGPLRKTGWHCSDTAELTFEDARVPVRNLVGAENGGFGLLMQQFVGERLALALQGYATAQRALDLAVRHATDRETFGRPLVSRQVIRHKLVEMHRRTAAARTVTRAAIEKSLEVPATDPDLVLDALMAKNTAVEAVEHVVSESVQIHGGAGYMRESEIDRHYRDARVLGIGGGATEVLTDLAATLLGY
ncbi:Acyl-CoA dehydrogenase, short-chain specific [Nocardioides aquaticus]|uniref:Acyl-CoA dehydrogenase, short-chain specific n=1 Tax=Nocardioides aquaticus TaxID=160826 RepID=A0ABX8EH03_9ACTN|nr:acyl-CoA dehydrogenase family protein [Nocardioides aquaticus]QVT79791.1 Acyl-CoA dehydrogenase, short-chain specific [Nocardioides aquaticus]